ncbi:hypothetical protein [Jiangella asiatica]|uniref:Uncharacterized protein n=1 Tax=Jiangella asiatica TaxID=2530372 RepID=A0A4V2Z2Y7_9ACTN|nr:hypothetical protein [Jiangella asiatica]TDE10678.1 hypothetical protein E1269_11435 [Jiangella asiatica]
MKLRVLAVATAATLSLAAPATVAADDESPHYTGMRYDNGGVATPIGGPVEEVDRLADEITAAGRLVVQDVAERRQQLPYGRIETEAPRPGRPELVTYPAPDGIAASQRYAVSVSQFGRAQQSFVYQTDARKPDTNLGTDTSWTSFSFSGIVHVEVRDLSDTATGCRVRPSSLRVPTRFHDGSCRFVLTDAANVSVEFEPNTTNPVEHAMLVFANPPETDVPDPDDPNVRYFGPGIHRLGRDVQLHSNETVYLAGGAWVEGAFVGQNLENVVIKGRGIVSGLFLDTGDQDQNKSQPGLINILDSANVLVDGITFVDGPRFNVRALGQYVTLRNLKIMSWWFSTDGVVGGNTGVIENNFIKVNDDSVKLHWGDNVVRRNVIWQLENGGPFNISWNIHEDVENFHVYDNDIIHAEHYRFPPQAIFRSRHAGSGHMRGYLFENIRVEDANWRLFYIPLENNKWYDPALGYGEISDVIFRDITAQKPFRHPNVVTGIQADGQTHLVHNINVVDVTIDGVCLASAADGNVQIDPATTDEVRIMRTEDC